MTVSTTTDVGKLYNIDSEVIKNRLASLQNSDQTQEAQNLFSSVLNAAINNISETNGLISDKENEQLKLAMGISENPHDLSIATQKAETALAYTVAVRDKLLDAYKEIMNMQI